MSCNTLLKGINPSCAAIKKPGGVNKRVWVGLLDDLETATFGSSGQNSFSALSFKAGKGFMQFIGKREKHNGTMAIEVSENFTLRNHTGNLVLYYSTPEQLAAIDKLVDVEGMFKIFETNAGQLESWGLNKGENFKEYGLKAASLEGGTGTLKTDLTSYALSVSGLHENLELIMDVNSATIAITGLTSANPGVISLASTTGLTVGDTIEFSGLDGNQVIDNQSVNGMRVKIVSLVTDTSVTIDAAVTGATPATTGSILRKNSLAQNIAVLNSLTVWPSTPI
jgi:hypothetical protein